MGQTRIIPVNSSSAIDQALEVLKSGGLVAFPTDTVYGLGVFVTDAKAIEAIYRAKDRPMEKAIPVLIGSTDDVHRVARSFPEMARKLGEAFWPGAITLIVPKILTLPEAISATDTVGVRVPDHPVARSLLNAAGPMAVTSANLSGKPSPTTAQEVFSQLSGRIDLILDGGQTPGGISSTVLDCTGSKPILLREGPISLEAIQAVLA